MLLKRMGTMNNVRSIRELCMKSLTIAALALTVGSLTLRADNTADKPVAPTVAPEAAPAPAAPAVAPEASSAPATPATEAVKPADAAEPVVIDYNEADIQSVLRTLAT